MTTSPALRTAVGVAGHPFGRLGLALGLFKLRIGLVIALTALGGLAVAPGRAVPWWQAGALFFSVLVAAAAAGAFNQYFEYESDRRMARTRARPFVTGALARAPHWLALIVALAAAAVAAAWLALNAWVALYTFLGAFFYAVVYTVWLKRRTWWNIVIGGLAGSFAVLAGAAAVSPGLGPEALLLAVVLFLWTPPHFWSLAIAYRDDYAAAAIPMLPVAKGERCAAKAILGHTVMLTACSLALAALRPGWIYLAFAAAGGALFIGAGLQLLRHTGRAAAMRCFHASLAQLSMVLLGILIDTAIA
jgi:protoheme IX farnesyltransferase